MHICFVCREYPPSLRGGGIASYQKEMAYGLVTLGHKVTVICASDNTRLESTIKEGNLTIIRLKGGDFIISAVEGHSKLKKLRTFYRYKSYRKRIRKTIEEIKGIDVIEVPEFGAEALYLQDLQIPVVVRLHTPALMDHCTFGILPFNLHTAKYYWQAKQEFKVMRKAKYITSCSNSLKEWAILNLSINEDRIVVVHNPINTSLKSQELWHSSNNENRKVLYVGTICDWKGCEDLCNAIKILHEKGKKVSLTMIGKSGSYADMLQTKFNGESWLDIKGFMQRTELLHKYVEADLVCFPSWWENFPMVCLEAMLNGAIVLGSNSGGMSEIIDDTKDGYLITPKDPSLLADKIEYILSLPDSEKVKISKAAQRKIEMNFSLTTLLSKTILYYERCIEQNNNRKL